MITMGLSGTDYAAGKKRLEDLPVQRNAEQARGQEARQLTLQEQYWLIYGLSHIESAEIRETYYAQIERLQVTASCRCGEATCLTVQFTDVPAELLTEVVGVTLEDGRILLVRHYQGRLAEMEMI